MSNHFYAVIMAGGGGTRLWPVSRKNRPKQMLTLGGDRTLFQMAVDRLDGVFIPENIFVVTVAEQAEKLQTQVPCIPAANYILEPMGRGTASVVGLAAMVLKKRDPQAVMAVLTADHFIENIDEFQRLLISAYLAANDGYLVTIGIEPIYPATGYGYIQRGEPVGEYQGHTAYHVLRFKEKPGVDTARTMLTSGDHDWNSGMFCWRADRILNEIQHQMPNLSTVLDQLDLVWNSSTRELTLISVWPTLKPEAVDYGIMEHAKRVAVLSGFSLGWNDVGSWEAIFEVLKGDENGNIILGAKHIGIDTESTLVFSDDSQRLITTIGLKDMIVIDTRDSIFICPRKDSQKVKQLVDHLKQNGFEAHL